MVDFLQSTIPCKMKKSQELISMDIHTSTKSYKVSNTGCQNTVL